MSYTKQTWATGDIITAEKLNHMEDGIAGAESGEGNNFCTITIDNSAGEEVLFQEVLIGENFVENSILIQGSPFEETPTGVTVIQAIPTKINTSGDEYLVVCAGLTPYAIASDMVNCAIALEEYPYTYIAPIDSTKPSSLKITVSTDEGGGGVS